MTIPSLAALGNQVLLTFPLYQIESFSVGSPPRFGCLPSAPGLTPGSHNSSKSLMVQRPMQQQVHLGPNPRTDESFVIKKSIYKKLRWYPQQRVHNLVHRTCCKPLSPKHQTRGRNLIPGTQFVEPSRFPEPAEAGTQPEPGSRNKVLR